MKYIRYNTQWTKWLCTIAFLASMVFSTQTFAQKKRTEPTASELMHLFRQRYKANNYDGAIDALYRYIKLRAPTKTPGVIRVTQKYRFKLILILYKHRPEEMTQIEEQLKIYINLPLGVYPRKAREMLVDALYKQDKWGQCIVAVENALKYNADPSSRAGAAPLPLDLEKVDWSKYEKKSDELEYSEARITYLHFMMAESYFKSGLWKECIEPYQYVVDHTKREQKIGHSYMRMINAMLALRDFDRLASFIPKLYQTNARYDIRVNIALMKMANTLYKEKRFNDALPLYRMILPRKELLTFHKNRLRTMRVDAGLPPEENMKISDNEASIFGTRDSKRNLEDKVEEMSDEAKREAKRKRKKKLRDAQFGRLMNQKASSGKDEVKVDTEEELKHKADLEKINELSTLIAQLEDLPPYELNIKYRMALIYTKVKRYWEAARFFDIAYQTSPKSLQEKKSFYQWNKSKDKKDAIRLGENSIYSETSILLTNLHEIAEAKKLAFPYLKTHKTGQRPRRMLYLFTRYYQENNLMKEIKELQPILLTLVPKNEDPNILTLDSHLYYMQGVADLVLYEFGKAEEEFKTVISKFPKSDRASTALYWQGMAMLYQKKFKEAYDVFETYINKYPKGVWKGKATYQSGVCKFGLGEYEVASNRFNYVIANYSTIDPKFPKSSIFADACSMRGDLRGAVGLLDDAEKDYCTAIARSLNEHQAKYAVFKLAEIYKKIAVTYKASDKQRALDQYEKIIKLVSEYRDKYQDQADLAKAMYWIGKSKLQKDKALAQEVIGDYFSTIVKYGDNVHQEGVDLMIDELVKITQVWLDEEQKTALLKRFRETVKETKNNVLKLRLRVLISKINHTEDVLGKNLLTEVSDLKDVPPPVLAVLCKISLKEKIYDRSEDLLRAFTTYFDDSAYIQDAYKLRCFALFHEKKYDETLACIQEAQERFGRKDDMHWAQLKKAEVLLAQANQLPWDKAQDKYAEAITENLAITSIAAWRGIPRAIATFQTAQVEEAMGDKAPTQKEKHNHWNRAFAYYQRLTAQYKGYARGYWAAEGYLACARCLKKLGRMNDRRNVYRALLYDRYVNKTPQARIAKSRLGTSEVEEIMTQVNNGLITNIVVKAEALQTQPKPKEPVPMKKDGGKE